MKRIVSAVAVLALSIFLVACSDNDGSKISHVEVRLTDAPGDYQEVNVDIQEVQVNVSSSDDNGWTSLDIKKGVYDLLKLTNGLDTLLGKIDLPAGQVGQIRLILGPDNSVRINDEVIALTTPSAQQSGLKIQIHAKLEEGVTYKILLDFDAARSIVSAGASGKYILKPVIRSIVEAESGSIRGIVSPIAASPVVYAMAGQDTLASAFADQVNGKFLIKGLSAGTYTVVFSPEPEYQLTVKDGVIVTTGNLTDMGVVTIGKQ